MINVTQQAIPCDGCETGNGTFVMRFHREAGTQGATRYFGGKVIKLCAQCTEELVHQIENRAVMRRSTK